MENAEGETTFTSLIGPELNESRPEVDKKLYRQILLPNGLRAVLISDTLAINHQVICDSDDESDEDEENKEEEKKISENDRATDEDSEEENDEENDEESASSNEDTEEDDEEENDDDDDDDDEDGDDGTRDAAAALVVGAGSMYDPHYAQGLAHFLEHMLFMGTEKYPGENAYDAFLSKHGGSDNAYTEMEYTVYHLSIQQEKLFPALDMFAQFFIHPLLKEDAVERELNSIESEFQLSKNSDQCRLQQLMCDTSGHDVKDHPFATFSWGNLKSLKENPKEKGIDMMRELRKFYNQYYFAANMRLVVMGAYSLDVLQAKVEKYFSSIPSSPREKAPHEIKYENTDSWEKQTFETPMANNPLPLKNSTLKKIYRIVPVRDRHTLYLTWQVPSQIDNWRSLPCDYISHLIGHEANGSILMALKKKSLATGCFAGVGSEGIEYASSHALYSMSITLSEEGMLKYEDVIAEVFSYIGMLRHFCMNDAFPEWIHEELKMTSEISYRYSDEEDPVDYVEKLVDRLAPHFKLPPEHLLDGKDLLFDFNLEGIKNILENYLTPSNMRIDLLSSHFGRESDYKDENTASTEKIDKVDSLGFSVRTAGPPEVAPMFGTHYWCNDIPDAIIQRWEHSSQPWLPGDKSLLRLPPRNPYLPENLDLKALPPEDEDHPLFNASLKLFISDRKEKSWFPATVVKYSSLEQKLLLSYEDEEQNWHTIDQDISTLKAAILAPGYEGTFDNKSIKFRLVALAKIGEMGVMKYGDESNSEVNEHLAFPAIPPAVPISRIPKLVCDQKELKLWHLQDRRFRRPNAELRLRLVCSNSNKTPIHQACADLLVLLCADAVTETSYLASMCELGSSIYNHDLGFDLRVHGFNDKLLDLFKKIFLVLLSFRGRSESGTLPDAVDISRFEACYEVLQRRYENDGLRASKLASKIRILCLCPGTWSSSQKSNALQNIKVERFMSIISEIMESICADALFHGNVDILDANFAKDVILESLKLSGDKIDLHEKKYPKDFVTQLPQGNAPQLITSPPKDPTESNSAVEYYFQVGKDNVDDRAMSDLLSYLMEEPFYDQLRTKDQFGYSVFVDARWTAGIVGVYFSVISSSKSTDEITKRIEKFIKDYRDTLCNITSEEFMEHLAGLVKNKLDMFNSLSEECNLYWSEIKDFRYDWQVKRNEALALRSFSKEQVLKAYDEWFLSAKTRSLVVQVGKESSTLDSKNIQGSVPEYIGAQIEAFHKRIGGKNWGKVY